MSNTSNVVVDVSNTSNVVVVVVGISGTKQTTEQPSKKKKRKNIESTDEGTHLCCSYRIRAEEREHEYFHFGCIRPMPVAYGFS